MIISMGTNFTTYTLSILLPLSLGVFLMIFKYRILNFKGSIVLALLLIQAIIRYIIIPVLMSFEVVDFTNQGISFYHNEAILLMIVELFVIFLALSISSKKHIKIDILNNKGFVILPIKASFLFFILIGFAYIYTTGYFAKVNLIWRLSDFIENKGELEETGSLAGVLFYPLRMLLSLYVISVIFNKVTNKRKQLIYLFAVIGFNSLFIVGTSRFSIIWTILPLLLVIVSIFPYQRKAINIGFLGLIIIVLSITTINKFSHVAESSSSQLVSTNTLNAYFSGPGNESLGLDLYYSKSDWERFNFLFSDLFQNVPGLVRYTNDNYKTNVHYNEAVYGHRLWADQIVPLSLNGMIHFGAIGPLVYPFIFVLISSFFERKYIKARYIGYKLVYITIAISFALVFTLNIGSIMASLFRNLLFLGVPLHFIFILYKRVVA